MEHSPSLVHIKGNSYYVSGIFASGVYINEKHAVLIDSGSDQQSQCRYHYGYQHLSLHPPIAYNYMILIQRNAFLHAANKALHTFGHNANIKPK